MLFKRSEFPIVCNSSNFDYLIECKVFGYSYRKHDNKKISRLMHIPLPSKLKATFTVYLPVNYATHVVMSSLIFFLG